jgi:ABC-type branched-subunit amino acid transport system substrate-binding protein
MLDPQGWLWRQRIVSVVAAALLLAALLAGLLLWWRPWQEPPPPAPCGEGMTLIQTGATQVCVGINIASTAFRSNDPLAELEARIATLNAGVSGDFATIVLLDNMTPDPGADSITIQAVRHEIEGAITAINRANTTSIASGQVPKLKLMLANWGSDAAGWAQAVDAIKKTVPTQHITAVTGITQSLVNTRNAVAALAPDLVTVSSLVTADDMGIDKDGTPLPGFFRVSPTNSDEAAAAANYIAGHYHRILVLSDVNRQNTYAKTLSDAFLHQPGMQNVHRASYESPDPGLVPRLDYVTTQFARMHSTICADRPDLIYFAGRGADLRSFLTVLGEAGACGLGPIDIITGDSGSYLVGQPLPPSQTVPVRVFYTGVAAPGQWGGNPSDERDNYQKFLQAFTATFDERDLDDGYAIMSHDAVLTAATAIRDAQPHPTRDPSTVRSFFLQFNCTKWIPGASGKIVFKDSHVPANKAIPIMQVQPDGVPHQQALVWSTGQPFNPNTTC